MRTRRNAPTRRPAVHRRSAGGYSLVEVCLATLVLAVGLTSLLAVFPTAVRWGGEGMAGMTGAYAAQSALAEIQRLYHPWDGSDYDLPDTDSLEVSETPHHVIGEAGTPGAYYCRAKYERIESFTNVDLWRATIWVYRVDPDHRQFDAKADTLCTYYGTFVDKY